MIDPSSVYDSQRWPDPCHGQKGHLIESGTHDELLKKGGKYAQMWSSYTESINWKISTGKAV